MLLVRCSRCGVGACRAELSLFDCGPVTWLFRHWVDAHRSVPVVRG